MKNVNPMWESLHITDAQVVEHFADLIPKDEREIDVDPSLIGKKELNRRVGLFIKDENYLAKLETLRREGINSPEREKIASDYADGLHEIFEASTDKLYALRDEGKTMKA